MSWRELMPLEGTTLDRSFPKPRFSGTTAIQMVSKRADGYDYGHV